MRRNTINYFLCICFLLCLPNNDLFGMNRGISSVSYNKLNLPGVIDVKSPVAEARNYYMYSSDGVKQSVVKTWNPNYSTSPVIGSAVNVSSLTSTETTDYIGNLIYEGGTLKRIQTENGYIENGVYHYYLTDYQGNIRMVATSSDQTVQWLNYYPFGMLWADKVDNNLQPYKYSGKELDSSHGLNLYDFHARFYDPALGRFMTMDPLAEKYYSWSPYVYCLNNPMKYVDPDGKMPWVVPLIAVGKGLLSAGIDAAAQVSVSMANGEDFSQAVSGIDVTSVGASFVTGALATPGMSTVAKAITGIAIAADAVVDVKGTGDVETVGGIVGEKKELSNVAVDAASSVIPGKAVEGVTSAFNKAVSSDLSSSAAATLTKETKASLKQAQTTVNSASFQTVANAAGEFVGGMVSGQANEELEKKGKPQ